jgi:hypothetical protein
VSGNGNSGVGNGEADAAWAHLAGVRNKVAAYAAVEGFVLSDIFLPAMSEATRRSPGGVALVELLKTLDADEAGQVETDDVARFARVPFLVVTLLNEETGGAGGAAWGGVLPELTWDQTSGYVNPLKAWRRFMPLRSLGGRLWPSSSR